MNRNVVATISHNKYKDVLLNNKWHSMNRIQSKTHRIGTYEINNFIFLVLMTKYISIKMDMAY